MNINSVNNVKFCGGEGKLAFLTYMNRNNPNVANKVLPQFRSPESFVPMPNITENIGKFVKKIFGKFRK